MARHLVTVFGGSGFIGRYVVKHLADRGHVVRVAVRDPVAAQFLQPLGDVGQIVSVRAPITDDAAVAAAVAGAETVINLVGILFERGRGTFDAIHARGAERVAKAAAAAGTRRLVHISAIGAHAAAPALYARSKAAGEAAVLHAFPTATVLRPSIVIGPEDNFFNKFARLARVLPALPLIGGGTTRMQPVYVGDVADAVIAVLDRPEAQGRIYELGGPRIYTFRELMELMLRQINRRRWLVSVPFGLAGLQAAVLERLPRPLLTRDQVKLLRVDNVVAEDALGLRDLGLAPQAIEAVIPDYLVLFRRRLAD